METKISTGTYNAVDAAGADKDQQALWQCQETLSAASLPSTA